MFLTMFRSATGRTANQTIYNTAVAEGKNGIVKGEDGNETGKHEDTDDGVYVNKGDTAPYVEKRADKSSAKVGDKLTYTVTLGNTEDAVYEIENAAMSDAIPAGMDFVDGSVQLDGVTTKYSFDHASRTLTVPLSMQGKLIVNTAVLHDGEDTTPLPDAGVQIDEGEAEPIVSKSANVTEAKVGDTISYKITVKNGDHATAPWKNVVAYDTLPAGVKLVGNVYLDGKVALHKLSGNALSVLVGDLAAGESMTVTFDVQVLDTAAGTILQNSVTVSGDNGSGTATDDGVTVPEVEPQNPTDPTGFYVTKDVDKTVVDVSKSAADEQKTATFTITVGNNGKEPWKNVVLKDTLDTSMVTPVLQDNVYVDGVLNNKWSFADKVFTLELGDIAPGAFHEIKLTVQFKADAGGKTYVNYVTGAGDNGNATGQSPEVEIISEVDEPVTDIHYQLFNGYGDGKWRPGDRISLQEACTVAYRLIADGGNTWLERGTVTVPDYAYTIPEEAKYFVSIGVLPASVFDTTQMTEDTDYEVNYEITENGYLRVWATAAQLNALVKYVTSKNAGVSGDVSRLTFAKVICQLTGRDTSPDTTGYSRNVQYYPDVTSSIDLVTEVSHEHDYMLDADGNEYWI